MRLKREIDADHRHGGTVGHNGGSIGHVRTHSSGVDRSHRDTAGWIHTEQGRRAEGRRDTSQRSE